MAVILTQLDKIILSKVLTLEAFGYYSLAWMVASGLYYVVSPIFSALFPRFSQLATLDNSQALIQLYHRSCQLMSVILAFMILSILSNAFVVKISRSEITVSSNSFEKLVKARNDGITKEILTREILESRINVASFNY